MIFLPLTAALSLTGTLPPQDESLLPPERVFTPDRVQVGADQEPDESVRSDTELLEASVAPVTGSDDRVPLPIPATVKAGPEGDEIVREASGDPFFLGFAAGPHYPPASELVDPALLGSYQRGLDARPGDFTYACVMFSRKMTQARIAELEAAGCRLLGFHPHYTVKVAIPFAAISTISTLPFVRWVGAPQTWQKLSPHHTELTDAAGEDELMPFHVSVWESDLGAGSTTTHIGRVDVVDPGSQYTPETERDQRARIWQSNGWMHAALLQKDIQVEKYAPSINAFQVLVTKAQLQVLTQLDFVLFVEPVLAPTLASAPSPHDESTAMVMSDYIRSTYDGGTNQVAIVGIIDSGVENDHNDLSGITPDFWGVGWACDSNDPWDDDVAVSGSGHGTHCTGTVLGRGRVEADQLGNAPGLAQWGGTSRYFNFRGFDPGSCINASVDAATDLFANSYDDGTDITARPMVVTNSWGYWLGGAPIGSEANCRILDEASYDNDQLYVFCTGNEGSGASSVRIEGSSKNVLSVGSITDYTSTDGDPGSLRWDSSRGPTGDNRWKPNITAPGSRVRSLVSDDNSGYGNYNGTSMATPHVAAAAATLCDHYSWVRYKPELLASMLMATAITDDNQTLTFPSDAHLDTFGAGRLNSTKSHYNFGDFAYIGNWTSEITNANWTSADFTVASGTTRLVAVMHYLEEQCSAGASQALVNDWDLWLDRDPIDPAGNTGEYFSHQSTVDNTEIRIIDNPATGLWRWKAYPDSATANAVKIGVTIYAVLDDTETDATFDLEVDDAFLKPSETVHATATIDPTSYIASAVILDRSGSSATLESSSTTLYDGVVTDLTDSWVSGSDITAGDVLYSIPRSGTWGLSYTSEGVKTITVGARSDNMIDKTASLSVTVDGTQPGAVSGLTSSSHTAGVWSNDPTITWTWTAASDALSGLQGYGIFETTNCLLPSTILDIGDVTSYTSGAYSSSTSGRHFNIRSADMCDNWDNDFECDGPYFIDVTNPGAPTFNSSDHAVGSKSCNASVTVDWNAASDAHSGVAGYSYNWSGASNFCPDMTQETAGTSVTSNLPPGTWYLHVRAIDVAGNAADCADVGHFGPFTIMTTCHLYFDGFESGNFTAGGWSTSHPGRCKVNGKSAFTGAFGARLKKGGQGTGPCIVGTAETWIELPPIDTTGWTSVTIRMDTHFRKNEAPCEFMDLQYWDGAAWVSFGVVTAHAWSNYTFTLPAGAMGNPALRVRMITNAKGKSERAEIDNVQVIGIE